MKLKLYKFALSAFGILSFFAVDSQAQVKAWGSNFYGQLGKNGSANYEATPGSIGQNQTTGLCGGSYHTLLLRANGTIFGAGFNGYGQIGNGTLQNQTNPAQTLNISTAKQISCGSLFSVALLTDGTVRTWGRNNNGQLGDDTHTDESQPIAVPNLTDVVAVDAGWYHALALKSDGTVWAWGRNDDGQLGDGTFNESAVPVQVANLSNVIAVRGGTFHSVALKADGTVWVWGANSVGEIGNNTMSAHVNLPTQTTISGVSQIAAGAYHNAALKPDGSVWIWGVNDNGQLGNGTSGGKQLTPLQNNSVTGAIDVRTKGNTNYVRLRDGSIQAWGENDNGETGSGNANSPQTTPVQTLVGASNPILGVGINHAFVAAPQITLNTGANQTFQGDSLLINFSNVLGSGTTGYTAIDPTGSTVMNTVVPMGYTIQPNEPAYSVSTSAAYSAPTQICIQLNGDYDPTVLKFLRVLHGEGSTFADRTTTIDLRTRRICASVASFFQTFVIARGPAATAADSSLSGRVLAGGRGLANARVEITGTGGRTRTVITNSFGNFKISDVETGATYVVNVSAKRYAFAPQVISVTDSVSGLTFIAQ